LKYIEDTDSDDVTVDAKPKTKDKSIVVRRMKYRSILLRIKGHFCVMSLYAEEIEDVKCEAYFEILLIQLKRESEG